MYNYADLMSQKPSPLRIGLLTYYLIHQLWENANRPPINPEQLAIFVLL